MRTFLQRAFQIRLASLIVLVAGSALVIEAWKYSREYADFERAWVSMHVRQLGDPEPRTRLAAAYELAKVRGPAMRRVVPALLGALRDEDTRVRVAAAHALGVAIHGSARALDDDVAEEIREATPALVAAVGDKDPRVRAAAAGALGALNIPGRSALTGPNPLSAHGPIGPDRVIALPALLRAAHDPDGSVRFAAVAAIGMLSDDANDAPAALIEALHDADPEVRESAVSSLGRPWRNRAEVFLIFLGTLSPTRDAKEAQWTCYTLRVLGPPPIEAVPGLVEALRADGDCSDALLVDYLSAIGPPARAALPKLTARAVRELQGGRLFAALPAMIAIAPESPETQALIPSLIDCVAHPSEPYLRSQAAEWLIRLGPHARAAVPAMREVLAGSDPEARAAAGQVLKSISGD